MRLRFVLLGSFSLLLAACASPFTADNSEFRMVTAPDGALCALRGRNGFSVDLHSPATLKLPEAAAPIVVRCTASGYRTAFAQLRKDGHGWSWMPAHGEVLDLVEDRPRDLRIVERVSGQPMRPRPVW